MNYIKSKLIKRENEKRETNEANQHARFTTPSGHLTLQLQLNVPGSM